MRLLTPVYPVFQFFALVNASVLHRLMLEMREKTVFAPTNHALNKFNGQLDTNFIDYHISES